MKYFDTSVKTALEVNFIILKTMFNPFPFIFVILELKFFLSVAHWGHGAKHSSKKCCTLGTIFYIGCNGFALGATSVFYFAYSIKSKFLDSSPLRALGSNL